MPDDEEYYEGVANYLASMTDGQSFVISDIVRRRNLDMFLDCFKWFVSVTWNGPYWWDWDGDSGVITKHEKLWFKQLKQSL